MTTRRPLVNVGGTTQELPVGDDITGAAGSGPGENRVISSDTVLAAGYSLVLVDYLEVTGSASFDAQGDAVAEVIT